MGDYKEPGSSQRSLELQAREAFVNQLSPCHFPLLTDGVIVDVDLLATNNRRGRVTLELGSLAKSTQLYDFCVQSGLTLPTIFNVAWALVLGRYIGGDNVGFISVRSAYGLHNVGICEAEIDETNTILQALKDAEKNLKQSFLACSSVSLRELQNATTIDSRQVFNSAVILHDASSEASSVVESDEYSEDGYLVIHVEHSRERLMVELSYPSALLPEAQAENVASTYRQVLSEVLISPQKTIAEINFMSPRHLGQIWSWNRDTPEVVSDCVHLLFETRAKTNSKAQAVDAPDGTLTYGELHELSNRLAYHLVDLGVGPEVAVPLFFEKSKWAIITMLAVIKAGGAIVNLDANQPTARLIGLMEQLGATLALTSRRYEHLWEDRMKVCVVDEGSIAKLPVARAPPAVGIRPSNLLYIIFTSGSTGTPKGVVVEHESFLTAAAQHVKASNMTASSRVLQMTPYTFDVSMLEIFTTLTTGACVCFPGDELAQKGISAIINGLGITWTFMTPSLIRLVDPADVPTLQTLALGGEALGRIDVTTWAERLQLINGYGPSECSVAATINERLVKSTDHANIGRGAGAICWVVDANDHNRLVPIGAVGELIIQGPIVARGYFNNPEKTAEVFLDEPPVFEKNMPSRQQQLRLYKTGDLVRINSDGTISFIGRKDKQVKLRGLRFELGEIEHCLSADSHVRHTLVILPKNGLCRQRLVGVISLHDFPSHNSNDAEVHEIPHKYKKQSRELVKEIRDRLAQQLPSYMVPTAWLALEALPFTTSGKINGVVMTKWIEQMSEETYNEVADVAPEENEASQVTEIESRLQVIWSDVLGVPVSKIGFERSFISIGGDSISAMKVAAACREQDLEVSVPDILLSKGLADLAAKTKVASQSLAEAGFTPSNRIMNFGPASLSNIGITNIELVEDVYGCSPVQEGILLSQVKFPGTYEIRQVLRVKSHHETPATIQRLQLAWQKVVDRHASLRTVFVEATTNLSDGGLFHQVVLTKCAADIKCIGYSGDMPTETAQFLKSQPSPNYRTTQPQHRFTICHTVNDEIYIMVELSHAIIDGGSTEVVLRDLAVAFDDKMAESRGPLYSDYISYLQRQSQDEGMDYWTSHLSGIQPTMVPMYDGDGTHEKQIRSIKVDFSQSEELFSFSEVHGVTVANILQTAWGLVLRTYTGSDDVCFGYVASGRDVPVKGIENAVGAFINMLVSRLVVKEDTSVVDLAESMQSDYFMSLRHQHCSLAQIQHALDMSGLPLFNTIVSVQRALSKSQTETSLIVEPLQEDDPTDFDIAVSINVGDHDLEISLGYWSSLLSEGAAANIASTFSGAISRILEQKQVRVGDLDLFNERDHQQIFQWNHQEPVGIDGCVHDFVRERVKKQPHAQAICSWDGEFTYAELDDLSDRLAHHLVELGAGPEVMIPHCFDKSKWAAVSMYAIMKAGGATVGLSPAHPVTRIQSIIENCGARIVLVAPQHTRLMEGLVEHLIVIEPSFIEGLLAPQDATLPKTTSKNPAFVSFTSGSTGKPKGIVLEHGSLITSIQAHGSQWGINPGSRVLQFSAYAFDASVSDTFTTLVRGGTVCIASEKDRLDDLAGAINTLDVNWAFLTPRVLSTLSADAVPGLRTVVLGGEALSKEDIAPWTDSLELRLVYGPTECTIFSTGTEPVTATSDPLCIGRAVGTRVWVVDAENTDKLVPVGCIGELVIEGPLVTRGYLKEPDKTKAAYFQNPVWLPKRPCGTPHRFYKTSDLVRYYPDGQLQFIGRKDTQVKIRGQRVELGEIEHAITENLSNLVHVTVDAVAFPPQTLVAFLYMKDGSHTSSKTSDILVPLTPEIQAELKALEKALTELLPIYMVPAMFISLSHIPMTISGKVDRIQLRAATLNLSTEQREAYCLANQEKNAPTTGDELKLQSLWSQILSRKKETIGTNDSFFRLGGDSIGAMKLVAAARREGLVLAVADIFKYPELAEMAQHVPFRGTSDGDAAVEPFTMLDSSLDADDLIQEAASQCQLEQTDIQDIYPCTPLQEGVFIMSTTQAGAYVAQTAFKLPVSLDLNRFQDSWQIMVNTHSILRTRIVTINSISYQVVLKAAAAAIQWQEDSSLENYLLHDKDLSVTYGAPLARYAVVNNESRSFVWTAHHAIYDGWTVPLLFDQLEKLYHAGSVPVEAPYSNFIKHLQTIDVGASDAFWRSQLAGDTPASFPRVSSGNYQPHPNQTYRLAANFNRKEDSNITMAILLRAAWALVMARYADSNDIVYGLTLSGRDASVQDIGDVLGPTITTVPINVHLDQNRTVEEFLQDMQKQNVDMMPFQHAGLQRIRRVNPEAPSASDFQNLFVVQPQSVENQTVLGLETIPTDMTQFDTYALVVECALEDGRVDVEARFDDSTLSTDQVQRMLSQFEHVIEQLNLQSPTTRIRDIELLSQQDNTQIWEWNSVAPTANDECIHDMIARRVAIHPDAMAVESWDGNLTYRELDDLTSRLAHYLSTNLGIKPEVLVPLCFDKSVWTVVIMISVVKAGGACVMLNPDHPVARLGALLEDIDCHVTLSSPGHSHLFSNLPRPTAVIDSSLLQQLPQKSAAELASLSVSPTNPAVVIFTSGSTGKPKGIIVQHNCLCTVATQHGEGLGFEGEGLRVLQFATYTFDVSVGEIFITLMKGGTICIPTEYDRINNLAWVINSMKITWTFMTPTVAALLDPKDVPDLKTLVLGGEAVSQSLVDRWAKNVTMIDSYGPAECTIWTSHALPGPTVSPANIGWGVGCRTWVVEISDHNRLAPVGCVGELLIEGPNVARGYMNEPEKTKTAFIEDPSWMPEKGHRFYKSGDLVRYHSDGSLLICGRKDNQVKFHGQRIELGEIEFHLRAQPDVEAGMVALPKAGLCKAKLVASVAISEFKPAAIEGTDVKLLQSDSKRRAREHVAKIQDALSSVLPPYMVPSIWVVLDSIPLTASRKINRVPITKWITEISEEDYLAVVDVTATEIDLPTTPMEKQLAEIWSRILDIPEHQIGVNRSFLSLGGDSITAMQVVSHCRALKVELSVKDILESKNLSEAALRAKSAKASSISKDEKFGIPFALSPIQQLYFDEVVRTGGSGQAEHHYNQSILLHLTRQVQEQSVTRAFQTIVRQHSMLRANFTFVDGKWMQTVSRELNSLAVIGAHTLTSRREMLDIIELRQTSMDIQKGPLFTLDLFTFAGGEQMISLISHHLIIDAVSWRVIVHNLEELLESQSQTMDDPLPFQVWTKVQATYSQSLDSKSVLPIDIPKVDLQYWGMSRLPTWNDVEEISFVADEKITSLLLGTANTALHTEPLDILISIIQQSFVQTFTDRTPPTVFTESHGREPWNSSIDLASTVGWFTTFCPIHVSVTKDDDAKDILRRVKDARRQLSDNGFSYFSCHHFNPEGEDLFKGHKDMEICFNYLGRYQQLERDGSLLKEEPLLHGEEIKNIGGNMGRLAVFDISASVTQGRLRMSYSFNRTTSHIEKIGHWIVKCEQLLKSTVELLDTSSEEQTLSDFPLMKIDYAGLSKFTQVVLPKIGVSSCDVEDLYPCSPMQEGILLSQARQPGTYEVRQLLEVVPRTDFKTVDIQRLRNAWQKTVQRHAALRTVFIDTVTGDRLYDQLVLKQFSADVKHLKYNGADVGSYLEDQPTADYTQKRPHHRITICETRDKTFLQLEISHSLIDGTSMALIMRDFTSAYENSLVIGPDPLYKDYIAYLQTRSKAESLGYWTSYLADVQPCHFPRLRDATVVNSPTSNSLTITIDHDSQVQKFCEEHEVTMGNLFQAAWGLILKTYTGSSDVCFGYMAAGRDIPIDGVYDVVGPLINILVCRMSVDDNRLVKNLLKQLQTDYLDSLPHQHTSLATIQHELEDLGTPLFNTIMSLQRLPPKGPEPQVSFNVVDQIDPTEYDVDLQITTGDVGVEIHMAYLDSHLCDDQASSLIHAFANVITSITSNFERTISNLNFFTDHDKNQVWKWNSAPPRVLESCLHSLFEQQVEIRPNADALVSLHGDTNFTYHELEVTAARLARHLQGLNIGPEVIVPLCFEKSSWAVVAMLAVLKAGGAYVAMDPQDTLEHLRAVVSMVGAQIVLCSRQSSSLFNDITVSTIYVDNTTMSELSISDISPVVKASPHNLAAVVFGSHTTFERSGILLEHRSLSTVAHEYGQTVKLGPSAKVLQLASYDSAFSIAEILYTLSNGGTICIPPAIDSNEDLEQAIQRMGVNWAFLTPTVADAIDESKVPSLQTLLVGGESMAPETLSRWADVDVLKPYGPVDDCIWASVAQLTRETAFCASGVGLGTASRMWITETSNPDHLAPVGAVGELVIEGPTAPRGYLNQVEQNNLNFVENPSWLTNAGKFSIKPETRHLYRTADLARYAEDNTITIVRRKYAQCTLNGQPIDIREVERQVKLACPNIYQTIVDVTTPVCLGGTQSLAVFVAERGNVTRRTTSIHALLPVTDVLQTQFSKMKWSLSANLPKQMVPTLFIPVAHLPLTSHNKADRATLLQLASALTQEALSEYSLTRTEKQESLNNNNERILRDLWIEVLGLRDTSIGYSESFFRLGGDSIGAMRLVNAAHNQGLSLTVAAVFQHPILSEMAKKLEILPDTDDALEPFSLLGSKSASTNLIDHAEEQCGVQTKSIEDIYPCTPLQEGLMAITSQNKLAYINHEVFNIPSSLDIEKFKNAWDTVVSRSSILRTRIIGTSDGSFQVLLKEGIDWQITNKSLEAYLKNDREIPMEYGKPLARYALVGKAPHRSFVWTAHHSIYDGLTLPIIARQVSAAYLNELALPEIPYNRFIRYLQNVAPESTATFWKAQFSDHVSSWPSLPAPTYQPSANIEKIHTVYVSRPASEITISTVVRAAWAIVLGRLSESDNVTFGVTLSGRNAPIAGITQIVGPTLTTVPINIGFNKTQSLLDFLRMVQQKSTDMIPFEHTGLQNIRNVSEEAKDAVEFRNLLLIQPASTPVESSDFLDLAQVPVDVEEFDPYPLVIECNLHDDRIDIKAQYDGGVISGQEVQKVLKDFDQAIRRLNDVKEETSTSSDEDMLDNVGLISDEDLNQIMDWNSNYPEMIDSCVHTMFENQVRQRPSDLAIDSFDVTFTYSELNTLADRLAQHLINLGVIAEQMIPLCFNKCSWTIIAMLGIMKSGGTCCMMNPEHPTNRLGALFDDLGATLAVCDPASVEKLSALLPTSCIVPVDGDCLNKLPSISEAVPVSVQPSDAVFVVYTSGSTGKPKGSILEHRSLVTGLISHCTTMGIGPDTRTFQFASYTFDVCIEEIVATLMLGGCVCVPSESERMNALADAMNKYKVTWTELTTTVASLLLPSSIPSLKVLVLSGESLTKEVINIWSGHVQIINSYGPSECCVSTTCNTRTSVLRDPTNIGLAQGCVVWIADPDNIDRLTPIGSAGELLIEGPIIARGYLNEPEKTAAAFIENPAWARAQNRGDVRLYRTGDLVKYNPDGSIKFIGRKDTQVKLHGQRIEMGEIEHQIKLALPGCQVAVEVLTPKARGNLKILSAFICEGDSQQGNLDTLLIPFSNPLETKFLRLQAQLFNVLPKHMVPSLFIPMTHMPVSASRKLDRKTLKGIANEISPERLASYSLANAEKRAPSTETENILQNLWTRILGTEQVGVDDNFFLLGGDSIAAMKVVSAATKEGVRLTVSDMVLYPILSKMAETVDRSTERRKLEDIPVEPFSLLPNQDIRDAIEDAALQCAVERDVIEDIYPCTALQEGLMAITARDETAYVSQAVYRLPVSIDIERFKAAWQTLAEIQAIMRTRIIHSDASQCLQVVLKKQITWHSAETLAEYINRDTILPMVYGQPLMRFGLVPGDERDLRFHFIYTAHHSVYDGWSEATMFEQVEAIYMDGAESLPPVIPYNNFIRYIVNVDSQVSDAFWRSQLDGEPPANFPKLPSTMHQPRPNRTQSHPVHLSRQNGSAFAYPTILKAAWSLLLSRHMDSDDVLFGHVLSGRSVPLKDVGNIIGPTIATVPMRVCIDRGQSVEQYMTQIQQQATEMMPFEQAGLQHIRRLVPQASSDFNHLFYIQPSLPTVSDELGLEIVPSNHFEFDTYALLVECQLSDTGLDIVVRYDDTVIPEHQMTWMLYHFENLVYQLTHDSLTNNLDQITCFGPRDLTQVLDWMGPATEPADFCVHDLVKAQAGSTPQKQAIDAWDGSLTYQELENLASLLGNHLTSLGVGAHSKVALCFNKSCWATVSMLAVLKSGAACVMLNPEHPTSRHREIIEHVAVEHMVVSPQHGSLFEGLTKHLVIVDESITVRLPPVINPSHSTVDPSCAAYLVFTSGSTGKPKAVVIDHRAICSSIRDHASPIGLTSESRALQFASYTFDISFGEIFTTLIRGGTVCVISDHDRMNNLAASINQMQVNWACLTPTVASLLGPEDVPGLSTLALSGECPTSGNLETWAGNIKKLTNIYGPSEASIWCSCIEDIRPGDSPSNIGRPIGCRLWITEPGDVDKLAPIGCVGELIVEGPILAQGYLNDSVKTDAAFLRNPIWMQKNSSVGGQERFYRTGDLVKYNSDGTIEYLGRRDTQIKLRGQRIEPREIEHHVKRHLPVASDVVVDAVSLTAESNKKVLVAYIYDKDETTQELDPTEIPRQLSTELQEEFSRIQSALSSSLPTYMIPSIFIPLNGLPTNASGKMNRLLLGQMVNRLSDRQIQVYSLANTEKRSPTTKMEIALSQLWAQALGMNVQIIGADDSFLHLGGDSIVAMKMVSLARKTGLSLSVVDVFRHPTLSEAAALLTVNALSTPQAIHEPFSTIGDSDIDSFLEKVVCPRAGVEKSNVADVVRTTNFQDMAITGALTESRWMLNYFWFDGQGHVDTERMRSSCFKLVQAFDILRTVFITHEARFWQVILRKLEPMFLVLETDDIEWLTQKIYQEGMTCDLTVQDPFTQFILVKQRHGLAHRLIMRISHAQYDGVSLPRLWEALKAFHDDELLANSPSFSDYVYNSQPVNPQDSIDHWRELLAGSAMTDFISREKPRLRKAEDSVTTLTQRIPYRPLTGNGITFATVMKSAWALIIAQLAAKRDVVFGHTISGRNLPLDGIDKIVGPCLNVIPVRVDFQSEWKVFDLLQYVQNQQLANVPYESLGFRDIIKNCTEWPQWSYFSSVVQHQNIDPDEPVGLGDTVYDPGFIGSDLDMIDVSILSTPLGDEVAISLTTSAPAIPQEFAQKLLQKLCTTVTRFCADVSASLPTPADIQNAEAVIPAAPKIRQLTTPVRSVRSSKPKKEYLTFSELLDRKAAMALQNIVERAWNDVLPLASDFEPSACFFALGGDIVSLAQLAISLRQQKFKVSLEDLAENSTVDGMVYLLSEQYSMRVLEGLWKGVVI